MNIHRHSLNPRARFEAAAILIGAHSHQCSGCKEHYGCRRACERDPTTDRYAAEPCTRCRDPLMIRTDQGSWHDLRYCRLRPIENGKGFYVWHNNKPVRLGIATRAADRRKCREYGQ